MNKFELFAFIIVLIILFKSITALFIKFTNFKDDKLKFTMDVKKENINKLTGIEFEGFCKWLFQDNSQYKNVELTPPSNDGGVDLILTCQNDEKIYVECKRYDEQFNIKDESKSIEDGDFFIGRVICQKLVGAMVANNVKRGIVITTGSVESTALTYLGDLEQNSDIKLEIYTMENIIKLIEAHENPGVYELAFEI